MPQPKITGIVTHDQYQLRRGLFVHGPHLPMLGQIHNGAFTKFQQSNNRKEKRVSRLDDVLQNTRENENCLPILPQNEPHTLHTG